MRIVARHYNLYLRKAALSSFWHLKWFPVIESSPEASARCQHAVEMRQAAISPKAWACRILSKLFDLVEVAPTWVRRQAW